MSRAIDHIGIANRNLDALAARYEALGFTLTPRAYHQDHMGTSNRLAQFKGRNFIELIEVDRPDGILPDGPSFKSFGAFARDFVDRREGLGLIVFRTDDTPADIAAWRERGLDTYEQFDFERQATLPDGSKVTVSFALGFVTHPKMPDLLFFVCHNRAEQHFWKPAFQDHANGAEEIEAVILAANAPEAHAGFLGALFGGEVSTVEGGISVAFGPHRIEVKTPEALAPYGWQEDPGEHAVGAGFAIRSAARAGTVTGPGGGGGAFIQWVN